MSEQEKTDYTNIYVSKDEWFALRDRVTRLEAARTNLAERYVLVEKRYDELLRQFDLLEKRVNTNEDMLQSHKQHRPTIVCLCGSTRFSEAFHEANLTETLAGRIVLSVGCDFKSDCDLLLAGDLTQADKARLDELHLRKIDLADEVLILNVNGYIGESTRCEIAYAEAHGKQIRYLEHKMSN